MREFKKSEIKYIPTKDLKLNPRNPRKNDNAVDAVVKSIGKYGFKNPLICDRGLTVYCGNTRLKAARRLNIQELPVIIADDLTPEEIREYALIDNKSNEIAEWDAELLKAELDDLDLSDFDFDWGINEEEVDELELRKREFEERMASGELSEDSEEYQEFLKKFETAKTTDDCYTPPIIYDAVADYVSERYGLGKRNFLRPFVPQGDYKAEKYKKTDIVVDNPPFSILSEIIKYYNEHGIKYFLFAPHLTLFSSAAKTAACLVSGVTITYENGATVSTSFVTNLENCAFRSCPTLYAKVKEANDKNLKLMRKDLPRYNYPLNVITTPMLVGFSRYGINFEVLKDECYFIRKLDAQKESGKGLFGSGYLISENKKAEREQAEQAVEVKKAEQAKQEGISKIWQLSERENKIIKSLK